MLYCEFTLGVSWKTVFRVRDILVRIRIWILIRISDKQIQIRILLFSSVTFKTATKKISSIFVAYYRTF
jgi:hypothetical protein